MLDSNLKLAGPIREKIEAEWRAGAELLKRVTPVAPPGSSTLVSELAERNSQLRKFLDGTTETSARWNPAELLRVAKMTTGIHVGLREKLEHQIAQNE